MAGSSSSIGFAPGDFTTKLQDWINDPSNVNNPITTLLGCLPNSEYTNSEFESIKLSISEILLEAPLYESKRTLNEALNIQEQLDVMSCMGEDATYLFANFINYCKSFIETYHLVKPTLVLESEVNQNPNYYNN